MIWQRNIIIGSIRSCKSANVKQIFIEKKHMHNTNQLKIKSFIQNQN